MNNDWMANPYLSMGLGILGANKPGASFGQAVGQGGMLGMQNYQQMLFQQALMKNAQMKRQQEEEERQRQEKDRQWLSQFVPPAYADAPVGFQQKIAEREAFPPTPEQTSLMQNLAAAGLRPGTPEYNRAILQAVNKPQTVVQMGPTLPGGYMWADQQDRSKGVVPIPGGPAEKQTEGQLTAEGYAERMNDAATQMRSLEEKGFSPSTLKEWLPAQVSNYAASPEYQVYRAAQEDWVRAKLRKESGAVIADEEMAREISTYFPQPGDSEQVKQRKAKQRATAEKAMATAAGGVYSKDAKPGKYGVDMDAIDAELRRRGKL